MSADTLFDRESYLVREAGSPQLEVAIPNFDPVETPPPDVKTREPSPVPVSDEDIGISARKRRGDANHSPTRAVLLTQLHPNRIGLAQHAGEYALDSESEADEDGSPVKRWHGAQTPASYVPRQPSHHSEKAPSPAQTSQHRCHGNGPNDFVTPTVPMPNATPAVTVPKQRILGSPADIKISLKYYDTIPPQLPSPLARRDTDDQSSSVYHKSLAIQPNTVDNASVTLLGKESSHNIRLCLHKYPRPDNLLRHVKAHHRDKDREDPLLADVLAQRPEGGTRGRRRRLGSRENVNRLCDAG
ncbi:hypothetical protein DV738_g4382, partial [Chaetothyriales sp. CBS 135597]